MSGFVFYSFKTIVEYFDEELGVKLKIVEYEALDLPAVTICHSKSFFFEGNSIDRFLELKDILVDNENISKWVSSPILSKYLGVCFTFTALKPQGKLNEYFELSLKPGQLVRVFIHDSGAEFWLQFDFSGFDQVDMEKLEVDTAAKNGFSLLVIELRKKVFKAIPTSTLKCDREASFLDYTEHAFDAIANSDQEIWSNFTSKPGNHKMVDRSTSSRGFLSSRSAWKFQYGKIQKLECHRATNKLRIFCHGIGEHY